MGEGQRTTTQSLSTSERVAGGWESKHYHPISLQAEEGGWWVGVKGLPTHVPPLQGGRLVGGCHANFIPKQDVDFQTSLIIFLQICISYVLLLQ